MVQIEECYDCDKMKLIYKAGRCSDCYDVYEALEAVSA